MSKKQKFCAGSPLEYATRGIFNIPSEYRRGYADVRVPIEKYYECNIGQETSSLINLMHQARDGRKLIEGARNIGLNEMEDYEEVYEQATGKSVMEGENIGVGDILSLLDRKLTDGLAPRNEKAEDVSKKTHRSSVYVPEVIDMVGDGGTVYMAKSLTSSDKVKIAWGLHEDNVVVCVDEYEQWEAVLGWSKLKELPHGRKKIREQFGDRLSDDVLADVAPKKTQSNAGSSDKSKTQRTRTAPSDEKVNVALSTRHKERASFTASAIKDRLDGGRLSVGYSYASYLILFPTTSDKNMTDYWWVAGKTGGGNKAAIANCNKGTYEYLNDLDNVMHIDDYISKADDYTFRTESGQKTYAQVKYEDPVYHHMDEETSRMIVNSGMMGKISDMLPDYIDERVAYGPDLADDITYCMLKGEDSFWLRPLLKEDKPPLMYTGVSPFYSASPIRIQSMYELYAHARLDEWDHDTVEMKMLADVSHSFELDEGGYELIETLAQLHDSGKQLYSESPKARWGE